MSYQIGFRASSPLAYRIYNVTLVILLLLVFSPIIAAIAIALWLTQGRSIFYRGVRMGQGMKHFHIIKFRTLCPERAKLVTANCTLPADSNIETPLGKLMRETRLDELPQMINVIRGDMNICGPRPVRPEIAAIQVDEVDGYAKRFEVRPGIIGPAQAYFGHGASKRLRARMNNQAVRRPVSIFAELRLLVGICLAILERILRKIGKVAVAVMFGEAKKRKEIWLSDGGSEFDIPVVSINKSQVVIGGHIAPNKNYSLRIRLKSGGTRHARVRLTQTEELRVYAYDAINEFGAYVIERYALGHVVVAPRIRKYTYREPVCASRRLNLRSDA